LNPYDREEAQEIPVVGRFALEGLVDDERRRAASFEIRSKPHRATAAIVTNGISGITSYSV
jgi:hypothetical protein